MNGNWGEWGGWSGCDAVCGRGLQTRRRVCDDPAPSADGCGCEVTDGVSSSQREECNDRTCSVGKVTQYYKDHDYFTCLSQYTCDMSKTKNADGSLMIMKTPTSVCATDMYVA